MAVDLLHFSYCASALALVVQHSARDLGIALSGDGGEPLGLFIGEIGRGCVARRECLHPYFTSKDERTHRRFKAILDSTCRFGTSAWLFALPNGGIRQRMTPVKRAPKGMQSDKK